MLGKICTICKQDKPLSNFDKHPSTKDKRGSQCRQCGNEERARRVLERKRRLVELLGGKCSVCGYNKCLQALDFHHPASDKEGEIATLVRMKWEKALKEAKKCVLLCCRCHREEHAQE